MATAQQPIAQTVLLGWHFLAENRCLQFPPYTRVEVGQTLEQEYPHEAKGRWPYDGSYVFKHPVLCVSGFHASRRALDALLYARGPVVCRVELWGDLQEDDSKAVATHRKCLAMADATELLREFADWCAEGAAGGASAAWVATWAFASDAAWDAAKVNGDPIGHKQNTELERRLLALLNLPPSTPSAYPR